MTVYLCQWWGVKFQSSHWHKKQILNKQTPEQVFWHPVPSIVWDNKKWSQDNSLESHSCIAWKIKTFKINNSPKNYSFIYAKWNHSDIFCISFAIKMFLNSFITIGKVESSWTTICDILSFGWLKLLPYTHTYTQAHIHKHIHTYTTNTHSHTHTHKLKCFSVSVSPESVEELQAVLYNRLVDCDTVRHEVLPVRKGDQSVLLSGKHMYDKFNYIIVISDN